MRTKNNVISTNSFKNIWSGFLFGLGLVAFMDETIFHQLLHWHHFYDRETTEIGLVSDGLFHAFSWFATIGGLFLYADLRRKKKGKASKWWGGLLFGAGFFQLYDGTIQHKILKLHEIRYVKEVFIYDFIWNLLAVIMIVIGLLFLTTKNKRKTVT
jgi:uncharacterized membrane protein